MKLFRTIQVYFALMGIKSSHQGQKYSYNLVNFVILATLIHFSCATTAFILCDAESFKQIANSFYAASASLSATLNLIVSMCNSSKFFELIESYETTIQSSKIKCISKT